MFSVRRAGLVAACCGAFVFIGGSSGLAGPGAGGPAVDGGSPIDGEARDRAVAAALAATGGGQVTGTERGDEDGFYEVEVVIDVGRKVDVQLDPFFVVLDGWADPGSAGVDPSPG